MRSRDQDEEEQQRKKPRKEEQEEVARGESQKRGIDEHEQSGCNGEKNWKKKKLNWLRAIARVPGVVPISKVQVVEIYSPERVAKVAKRMGMEVGLSMDLVTGWNFDKTEDRELAERYIRDFKPKFLL